MHVIAASSNGAPSSSSPHTTDTHDRHGYRRPPPEIATIVDAPVQPSLSFSPDRTRVLQLYRPSPYPPISELARPETKLAGLRIETDLWARSRMGYTLGVFVSVWVWVCGCGGWVGVLYLRIVCIRATHCCACMYLPCMCKDIHTHIHIHMHVPAHTYIYTHTHVYRCVYCTSHG